MDKFTLKKNNPMGILKVSIISVLLYNIAMVVPITGFLLPVYKIRSMPLFKKWEWIFINLLIIFVIGIIDKRSLGVYFIVFFMMEILYNVFKKIKFQIPVFDKIIITGVIITVFSVFYLKFLATDVEMIKKGIEQIYMEYYNMEPEKLASIFEFMRKNIFLLVYSYVGFITLLAYYTLDRENYKNWKISYQWLLFYIVPFLIIRFVHIENIYLSNAMAMAKITYVVYGIKIVYNFIRNKIKFDLISQILAVTIGMNFVNFAFVLGGLQCFEFIKVVILKNNNGGK